MRRLLKTGAFLALLMSASLFQGHRAATPGLPFTEDFSDTSLRDDSRTNANWSTEEQALLLAWRKGRYGTFSATGPGSDISDETIKTFSVALGDVDGDGDLDLVAGNDGQTNRLYLNNGTADPWDGVTGSDISSDAHGTYSVALGDVDRDGDLDLVAGNIGRNRLYLNNGTADPWAGVAGSDITVDAHSTGALALGDVDGDGDLDLVAGNHGQTNRLYLNNGTSDPWAGGTGYDITADTDHTYEVALGDVDGDGDLDLVAGNYYEANRLYLNNGTSDPWAGAAGSGITADVDYTYSVALGDVDGDGDLDLVAGNYDGTNRLYLNNGASDPWAGVIGSDISTDAYETHSVALGDVDGDGDLDLVAGNYDETNRLYLNNGTSDPWAGVASSDISGDAYRTNSVTLGDVDGDGDLDLVTGNYSETNRLYVNSGTSYPWAEVTGSDITSDDGANTILVALGDVDGDGDLDLVAGNNGQTNRLYLNNGTSDPWAGCTGSGITADTDITYEMALGDVDGDGDLDLVAGNYQEANRLYLNNGTSDPWAGVTGSDISSDADSTFSVALGDVDADGDLDLVAGNFSSQTNRLYLNNGTSNPWNGVAGSDITADMHHTNSVVLGDVDGDGDLDLVAGNHNQANRLYLNNGTSDPWAGVTGSDISSDADDTRSVVLGDVDGDGDLDLVAVNHNQVNRLYLNNGTPNPWNGVAGCDITADANNSHSVALGDVDGDGDLDLVVGNTQTNRLYLNNGTSDPWAGVAGSDISSDADYTESVALGDVDGDGDLDLVAGNYFRTNRLYLNNGSSYTWNGAAGSDITAYEGDTESVALGDVDGDGDLDLVVGNNCADTRLYLNNGTANPWDGVFPSVITGCCHALSVALGDVDGDGDLDLVIGTQVGHNLLYLNNGTSDPFAGVTWTVIGADADSTQSIALGDVDGDGDLDLVAGNWDQTNRLYLNNGTSDPWAGVTGSDISSDADDTNSVALGDVDRDGDLDLVAGNSYENRLYLNNGTSDPWAGVTGSDISSDGSRSIALADVDGDGDLDLVAGRSPWKTNRLYLNNGTSDPWAGVTGSDITADADRTFSIALGDVDGDGDLDLVAGNEWDRNRLYLNNGTSDPWAGVTGSDISSDTYEVFSVALGDVDGDGDLDLVAGNIEGVNHLYKWIPSFDTGHGRATSLRIDTETECITSAMLISIGAFPHNTGADFYLSNNGGARWILVRSGVQYSFPSCGTDLRWRADLHSLSPTLSPRIDQIEIRTEPSVIGDRVWEDLDGDGIQDAGEPGIVDTQVFLYNGGGALLDSTFTNSSGNYSFPNLSSGDDYYLRFLAPPGYVISLQDQGGDDSLDSDADQATGYTPVFTLTGYGHDTQWDAGMAPAGSCWPPDEAIYLYLLTLSTDGNDYPILHFMDPNQPSQTTGYNIYRSSDPSPPKPTWPLVADDIVDMDEATPNKQWVDISGDISPTGLWYYTVTAYNHNCPAEEAEGPF